MAVVGGGDSAVEEAIYLTRYATQVYLIHRRNRLRAQRVAQERAFNNPKIKILWDSIVTEILGEEQVTGLRLKNMETGVESILEADGLFIYIGNTPNTHIFQSHLKLDADGYIVADPQTHTSVPGVLAAGDVQEFHLKQISTAVGGGARAAMEADRFIAEEEDRLYPERTP